MKKVYRVDNAIVGDMDRAEAFALDRAAYLGIAIEIRLMGFDQGHNLTEWVIQTTHPDGTVTPGKPVPPMLWEFRPLVGAW